MAHKLLTSGNVARAPQVRYKICIKKYKGINTLRVAE